MAAGSEVTAPAPGSAEAALAQTAVVLPARLQELEAVLGAVLAAREALDPPGQANAHPPAELRVPFAHLQKHVEHARARSFPLLQLRQLLALCPSLARLSPPSAASPEVIFPPRSRRSFAVEHARRLQLRRALAEHAGEALQLHLSRGGTLQTFCPSMVPDIDPTCNKAAAAQDQTMRVVEYVRARATAARAEDAARRRVGLSRKRNCFRPEPSSPTHQQQHDQQQQQHDQQQHDHQQQQHDQQAKRRRRAGLEGLPETLIAQVRERQAAAERMAPAAVMERQRAAMRQQLPMLLDTVYLHFRSRRRNAIDVDKLVQDLAEGFQADDARRRVLHEQLVMLVDLAPEMCEMRDSKTAAGRKLFCLRPDAAKALPQLRRRLMADQR